ncbi:MAG: DUF1801 domain-containing protein [Armatimonadota bacterium]
MSGPNAATSPEEYIAMLDEPRRSHIQALYDLIREAAPEFEPFVISGKIGFGKFQYKGKTCEGEWFKLGLASNKTSIMIASCAVGTDGKHLAESYVERLPKAKIGKSCINFRKFEDIDFHVIREIAKRTASADFSNWVL